MGEVRDTDLLARAAGVVFSSVEPDSDLARIATARYFDELNRRFPTGFDPGPYVAEPEATYVTALSDGDPVAYGGLRSVPDLGGACCEVKRMWVHREWRGAGLGARLLRHLEELAEDAGYDRIVLDTNTSLDAAIAMYRRFGYREIARYNDNPYAELFFEKHLSGRAEQTGSAK